MSHKEKMLDVKDTRKDDHFNGTTATIATKASESADSELSIPGPVV